MYRFLNNSNNTLIHTPLSNALYYLVNFMSPTKKLGLTPCILFFFIHSTLDDIFSPYLYFVIFSV